MNGGNYTTDNLNTSPNKRRNKSQAALNDTVTYSQNQREPPIRNAHSIVNKPKSTISNGIKGDSLRDTSVNVASAFTQAVQDYTMSHSTTNGYSTATRNGVPDLSSRGLGAPPPSRARKPTSRRARGPEESDDDVDLSRLRGKSPLVEAATNFVRALSPGGSLYLRQRAAGVEDDNNNGSFQSLTGAFAGINSKQSSQATTRAPASQSQTSHQTSHGNLSSDYNYSREESIMKKMEPPPRPASPAKRKMAPRPSGTINVDKQAYKPPVDEDDEDEWSEDEKGHRRRRPKKSGPAQKGLNHLPVVGQAKHRRTRKRKGKDGQEEDGSETDTGYARSSAVRSLRGSVPPTRHEDTTWQESYDGAGYAADGTTSMEHADDHYAEEYAIADSQAHPSQSAFSIGGLMGRLVNLAVRTFAATVTFFVNAVSAVAILLLRLLVSVFDVLLLQPAAFVMDRTQKIFGVVNWSAVGKGIIVLLVIWMFINSLYNPNGASSTTGSSRSWLPWKTSYPSTPIDYSKLGDSAQVLGALDRRLQEMENRLIDMQFSQRRAVDRLDGQSRVVDEATTKLDHIDTALSKAKKAQAEAEEKIRESSAAAHTRLRSEVMTLLAQINHGDSNMSDEKLHILEKRLIVVEAGVKDAVEASKHAMKEAVANKGHGSSSGTAVRLWDKFVGTDGKTVTIKSTDGHDVTGLIGSLVDSAFLKWSKDDIAKPDFASYFAGARVIPQLTTQTYKIKSKSYWGNWGLLGSTAGEGRPPVTALHPDIHVGNCWPFKGPEGQLGVMLARSIIITDFTIDHAAKEVAFDVRSAPRKMEVWGLVDGEENIKKVADYHKRREQRYRDLVNAANREGRTPPPPEDPYPSTLPPDAHYLRLAQFAYNVNAVSHIQTFSVPQEIVDLSVDIGVVVLKVKSNWGEPNWTCLYRFRVSGRDVHQEPFSHMEIDEL